MLNKRFAPQHANYVAVITDGLHHRQAVSVLTAKVAAGLLEEAALAGYRDCVVGIYDLFWRYRSDDELSYSFGVQAAVNNGAVVKQYKECDRLLQEA